MRPQNVEVSGICLLLLPNKGLQCLDEDLTERLRELEGRYDQKFKDVYEALNYLLEKDTQTAEQKERRQIGYKI